MASSALIPEVSLGPGTLICVSFLGLGSRLGFRAVGIGDSLCRGNGWTWMEESGRDGVEDIIGKGLSVYVPSWRHPQPTMLTL